MVRRISLCFALVVLCASCQKFAEGRLMFREMLTLRDKLTKEFHEPQVDVTLMNGDRMTVKFINSPLASQGSDVKQKRADDVAAFVMTHYKHPVAKVTTVFVHQGGGMGVSVSSSDGYVGRTSTSPKP
jgi:hypothetical protein